MIGILIAILLAALAYWVCILVGLPAIVAIIAAVLVLLSAIGTGGYGFGHRLGAGGADRGGIGRGGGIGRRGL